MNRRLIVFDIGNSAIKVGLFEGAELVRSFRLSHAQLDRAELQAQLQDFCSPETHIVIGSVVTASTSALLQLLDFSNTAPFVISAETSLPIANLYETPKTVGVDRLANAVAAHHLVGGPAIVVDAGTAVNLDVVDESGAFVGGAILPGIDLQLKALSGGTSALPLISDLSAASAIGRNTSTSIASGVLIGIAGAVDKLIAQTRAELGTHAPVIGTGGGIYQLRQHSEQIERIEPDLTLQGLRLIYEHSHRAAA